MQYDCMASLHHILLLVVKNRTVEPEVRKLILDYPARFNVLLSPLICVYFFEFIGDFVVYIIAFLAVLSSVTFFDVLCVCLRNKLERKLAGIPLLFH
jgi:hypothetical protein